MATNYDTLRTPSTASARRDPLARLRLATPAAVDGRWIRCTHGRWAVLCASCSPRRRHHRPTAAKQWSFPADIGRFTVLIEGDDD